MVTHSMLPVLCARTPMRGRPPCKMYMMALPKSLLWGDLRNSARYQTADEVMKANPDIKRVVGHSLGGNTALAHAKHSYVETITYGVPAVEMPSIPWQKTPIQPPVCYRHSSDAMYACDTGAKTVPVSASSRRWAFNAPPHIHGLCGNNAKEQTCI